MKKVLSTFLVIILIIVSCPIDTFAATYYSDTIPAPGFSYTVYQDSIELWISEDVAVDGYTVFFSKELNSTRLLERNIYTKNVKIDASSLESGDYYMGVDAWRYSGNDVIRSSYYSYDVVSITTSSISAPSGVSVKVGNNGYVTVTWSKSELADGYFVFYSQDGGNYLGFGSVNEKGKCYFTGQLPLNHQYTFTVKQYQKTSGETLVSNLSIPSQQVFLSGPTVATPSNVTVKGGNNCVTISWNPVSGADGYYVFETNSVGGNPVYVGDTKAGTCYKTITGLDFGFHYYVVRAYDIIDNQSYYSSLSSVAGDYVSYSISNYSASPYNINFTVYVTRTGSKYHRYGCRYLHSSCIPISLTQAINGGYTPCSVCW